MLIFSNEVFSQTLPTGKKTENNLNSWVGSTEAELIENLKANCVPLNIANMTETDYSAFLEERRMLMANKMKNYYFSL